MIVFSAIKRCQHPHSTKNFQKATCAELTASSIGSRPGLGHQRKVFTSTHDVWLTEKIQTLGGSNNVLDGLWLSEYVLSALPEKKEGRRYNG